jgi:hypothetical protein
MRRVWHPYWNWEEWKAGMWRIVSKDEERKLLPVAFAFTGDANLYGTAMFRVIEEWPISCEHNLTDHSLNKQAWIGHAACALAKRLPEYIVRQAWGMLTEEQRIAANIKAQNAVDLWAANYKREYDGQLSFQF